MAFLGLNNPIGWLEKPNVTIPKKLSIIEKRFRLFLMKTRRIILTALVFFIGLGFGFAQTKKPAPKKKKAAPKAINVYLCNSERDKLYHKYRGCALLGKCSNEIKQIKSVAELKKYKRKSCTRCNNK